MDSTLRPNKCFTYLGNLHLPYFKDILGLDSRLDLGHCAGDDMLGPQPLKIQTEHGTLLTIFKKKKKEALGPFQ